MIPGLAAGLRHADLGQADIMQDNYFLLTCFLRCQVASSSCWQACGRCGRPTPLPPLPSPPTVWHLQSAFSILTRPVQYCFMYQPQSIAHVFFAGGFWMGWGLYKILASVRCHFLVFQVTCSKPQQAATPTVCHGLLSGKLACAGKRVDGPVQQHPPEGLQRRHHRRDDALAVGHPHLHLLRADPGAHPRPPPHWFAWQSWGASAIA